MDSVVISAIQSVNSGQIAYCKFLSANDTGETNAHQSGIYIAKNAFSILFDEPGIRGENKDKHVYISWQEEFLTESRFTYYGRGTRDEYRITRFGRGFPFLRSEHTGDLFVLVKNDEENYSGYILQIEEDIDTFLDTFAMGPIDTGSIIRQEDIRVDAQEEMAFTEFIQRLIADFPLSTEMSQAARRIFNEVYNHEEIVLTNPDRRLIDWLEMEYRLFRKIEFSRYGNMISKGFESVEQFIEVANTVLNRRKSRAGKSLEHNLSAIFDGHNLSYHSQQKTEGNKKPDFIFPSITAYQDFTFPSNKLIFLGAKTTCKDRWRQIINEADRIQSKHLFTLQQGISTQQLEEMETEHVILVVPAPYIHTYPRDKQDTIWTLKRFIDYVREQATIL